MNRVEYNRNKILIMMEPKMRNIMEKLKKNVTDDYFSLDDEEKNIISFQIARTVIDTTINMFNNYTREELPSIIDLAITNISMLEQQFVEMEMYAQAQMMSDAIIKIQNDISKLVGKEL